MSSNRKLLLVMSTCPLMLALLSGQGGGCVPDEGSDGIRDETGWEPPVCGDGVCESGETGGACPADCECMISGMTEGTFWEFMWSTESSSVTPEGSHSDTESGRFTVALGPQTMIGEQTAFPLEVTGESVDADGFDYAPSWRYLAVSDGQILGSTDEVTFQVVFDAYGGTWAGGGFFRGFSEDLLVSATSGTIENEWIETSAMVVSQSAGQSACVSYGTEDGFDGPTTVCPNEESWSIREKEYYKKGIGPIGYYFRRGFTFAGVMGSSFTTERHLGLVGTNLVGDDGFTAAGYPWNEKAPMPTARAELSSAVVNGRIYAIGGSQVTANWELNSLEEYDPLTDTWTTKAPMPTGRSQHSSVVVNGIIYVLGGNYVEAASNEGVVEAYDPATDTWSVEPPLAYGRFRHASCVVEGRYIVVAGGKRPDALFSATQVLAYDTATGETFEFTDRMPHAQWECSGTRVGNSFYLLGDLSGTSFRGTNSEFDLTTFTWTMKTNMPTARCNLTSSELNGLVYAIGGRNYSGKLRTVEAYDPATDTWTTRTPTERPRSGSTSAAVNGKIYVIGGYADGFNAPSSSVEEYDPAKE